MSSIIISMSSMNTTMSSKIINVSNVIIGMSSMNTTMSSVIINVSSMMISMSSSTKVNEQNNYQCE